MLLLAFVGVTLAATTVKELLTGLYGPRSIAYSKGKLFVAETGRAAQDMKLTQDGSVIVIGLDDEHSGAHARFAKKVAHFDR